MKKRQRTGAVQRLSPMCALSSFAKRGGLRQSSAAFVRSCCSAQQTKSLSSASFHGSFWQVEATSWLGFRVSPLAFLTSPAHYPVMKFTRRSFLTVSASASALSILGPGSAAATSAKARPASPDDHLLEEAAARPVLQIKGLKDPVVIESIELRRKARDHFVRVRSKDGAEGVSVDDGRMEVLHPILNQLVIPYFIGKDARDLEEHLFQVYRHESNYKLQGLALWCPVALVEFAILDMLGRIAGKSLGTLLGGATRSSVPFYVASGRRDTTP